MNNKWKKIDKFFFTYFYNQNNFLVQTYPFKIYSLLINSSKDQIKRFINKLPQKETSIPPPSSYYLPLFIGTTNCNFRCKYCYAYQGSYGQRALIMDKRIIKNTIVFLVKKMKELALQGSKKEIEIGVVFFGGESLLNFDGAKYLTESIKDAAYRLNKLSNSKFKPLVIINTNGSLFTGKILEFIKRNRNLLELVVSFDGLHHDKYRLSTLNKPTSEKVIEGIRTIQKIGVEFALGCCEPPNEIEDVDKNIRYITKLFGKETEINMAFIRGAIPQVKKLATYPGALEARYTKKSLEIFGKKVAQLIKQGYNIFVPRFYNRIREGGYLWRCPAALYEFCVYPNGNVYPCHNFIDDEFRLGNILDKQFNPSKNQHIIEKFRQRTIEKIICKDCVFQTVCLSSFDCPSHSYYDLGNFEAVDTRTCLAAKNIMEALFERFLDEKVLSYGSN